MTAYYKDIVNISFKTTVIPLEHSLQQFTGLVSTLPQCGVMPNNRTESFIGLILGIFGLALAGGNSYAI